MQRVLMLLLLAGCQTQAPCNGARCGEHGLLLFGAADGEVMAMHLPLYHAPHDRQVLLRLRAAGAADRAALTAAMREGTLVTLVPEVFDLDRLAPQATRPLSAFHGTLVRGHVERGGTPIGRVRLEVLAVPLWRPLAADAPRRSSLHYLAVDGPDGWYLVHELGGAPAFDHVLRVRWLGDGQPPAVVVWPAPNTPAMRPRPGERAAQPGAVQVLSSVWFETADLRD